MDLTHEAGEGYAYQLNNGAALAALHPATVTARVVADCPYLNTSPSAMAWHLGRFMAQPGLGTNGNPRFDGPSVGGLDASERRMVFTGKGDTFRLRGRKDILLGRFAWQPNNTFKELPR